MERSTCLAFPISAVTLDSQIVAELSFHLNIPVYKGRLNDRIENVTALWEVLLKRSALKYKAASWIDVLVLFSYNTLVVHTHTQNINFRILKVIRMAL